MSKHINPDKPIYLNCYTDIWTAGKQRAANEEGWDVTINDEGHAKITSINKDVFASDDAAEAHVNNKAETTSTIDDHHGTAYLMQDRYTFIVSSPVTLAKPVETIDAEARRLVYGDRQDSYGPPTEDFARIGKIWDAILGVPVSAKQVALCMVGVKLSREVHKPKRDNRVDGIGYLLCAERIETNT